MLLPLPLHRRYRPRIPQNPHISFIGLCTAEMTLARLLEGYFKIKWIGMKIRNAMLLAGAGMFLALGVQAQLKPVVKKVGNRLSDAQVHDLAIMDDGCSVVVGEKQSDTYWRYGFMALLNPDGSTKKEIIADGVSEGRMRFESILKEPGTGCFYVAGTTMLRSGHYASSDGFDCKDDVCLAKYDRNGNELWFSNIPWNDNQQFCGMGFTADGNISVAFCDVVMAPIEDFYVRDGNAVYLRMDFDSPDNNLVTQREFTCTFSTEGVALEVHELFPPYEWRSEYSQYISAGDGTFWYLVKGFKRKKTEENACYPHLFRLSESGEVLAEHLITGSTGLMMDDMMVLQDGSLLISIHIFGSGGEVEESGAYLFCFDKEANLKWKRYYYSDYEQPHIQSTQTPEGDIISVMFTPGNVAEFAGLPKSRCNMLITKLTPDGQDIWKKTILGLAHYQGNQAIDYYNGEIRIGVEGAASTDNGLPPDHLAYQFSIKDF